MPTYQYACTECGHSFEQVQSFSDESLSVCPQCEGRLRKVYNAVGVVFKGSGFYRNDSRAPSGSDSSSGESGKGSDAAGASGSSGDSGGSGSSGDSGGSGEKASDKPAAKKAETSTAKKTDAKPASSSS